MIRRYLAFFLVRGAIRVTWRVGRAAVAAAVVIAAAPVTLVAAAAAVLAWRRGWPPARLRRAAWTAPPMVAVWLAGTARTAASVRWLPPRTAPGWACGTLAAHGR